MASSIRHIKVIHEDNHLLIVNKRAGMLSQKDNTGDDSIIEYAKTYIKEKYDKPGKVFLGLPHRLDRPVSGAIILCRTSKSLTRMTEVIRSRKIKKIYNAIVYGQPEKSSDRIVSYIKKDSKRNKVIVRSQPFTDAKQAILSYQLLKSKSNKSLLQVELETGRPHQIRSQLAYIGDPIIGDLKYGADAPLSDKSIALHARQIEFIHPVSKEQLTIIAEWPDRRWWASFK